MLSTQQLDVIGAALGTRIPGATHGKHPYFLLRRPDG
jgi:hypothetical protein